jgi:DNA-binding GntR family transcriptional regulator
LIDHEECDMNGRAATGVLWNEPLHERATARLRDMIVQGQLAPGDAISEKDLCEEFGISRTPLREALKVLAREGLIELLPRRGAIVAPIAIEELRHKLELVRLLEDHAVKRACEHATDAQIAHLKSLHDKLLESVRRGRTAEAIDINDEFHLAIVNASGNESLVDVYAPLWQHLRRSRHLIINTPEASRDWVQAHERLMKAIRRRDGAGAVKELDVRWELADRLLASLSQRLDTPSATGAVTRFKPRSRE